MTRKYIRYSSEKETEVEVLLHFCRRLKEFRPDIRQNRRQLSLYQKLLEQVGKKISLLHEDLQYDYRRELERISLLNSPRKELDE